jgi:DNA ligase (NAD+)
MNNYLELCKKAYYEGYPIISDSQYDELERIRGEKDMGHSVSKSAIPHFERMYSLQKVFEGEDEVPFISSDIVETPKLDGAAISLLYDAGGNLVLGLTRGDGIKGEDITDKMLAWDHIPNSITCDEITQVTGEVVLPREIFNSRNKASGALGLKSVKEFLERDCTFIAYGLSPIDQFLKYSEAMTWLFDMGFDEVTQGGWDHFPQDGTVHRIDNVERYEAAGFTSKHPKGAYALKKRSEGVITTLLDVKWQVGKSGKVTPVAVLDPIIIEDATVTRATLNNIGFIRELALEIGDQVKVERAGNIIPRIICKV